MTRFILSCTILCFYFVKFVNGSIKLTKLLHLYKSHTQISSISRIQIIHTLSTFSHTHTHTEIWQICVRTVSSVCDDECDKQYCRCLYVHLSQFLCLSLLIELILKIMQSAHFISRMILMDLFKKRTNDFTLYLATNIFRFDQSQQCLEFFVLLQF